MNLFELERLFNKSWCKETSYSPNEWSNDNPSLGQCAVTSLIVNDYLGGEILWAEAILPNNYKISHYFNLIDGKEVDFTRYQFPNGTVIPQGIIKYGTLSETRKHILGNISTLHRYETLKSNLLKLIKT